MITNPTFSLDDGRKTVQMLSTKVIKVETQEFVDFIRAELELDEISGVTSIVLANLVMVVTFDDARTFTVTYVVDPAGFSLSSTGVFTETEYQRLRNLQTSVEGLMARRAMTALEVMYVPD